jgi:hypothetical protein
MVLLLRLQLNNNDVTIVQQFDGKQTEALNKKFLIARQ